MSAETKNLTMAEIGMAHLMWQGNQDFVAGYSAVIANKVFYTSTAEGTAQVRNGFAQDRL